MFKEPVNMMYINIWSIDFLTYWIKAENKYIQGAFQSLPSRHFRCEHYEQNAVKQQSEEKVMLLHNTECSTPVPGIKEALYRTV